MVTATCGLETQKRLATSARGWSRRVAATSICRTGSTSVGRVSAERIGPQISSQFCSAPVYTDVVPASDHTRLALPLGVPILGGVRLTDQVMRQLDVNPTESAIAHFSCEKTKMPSLEKLGPKQVVSRRAHLRFWSGTRWYPQHKTIVTQQGWAEMTQGALVYDL